MDITINFGLSGSKKQVSWYTDVMNFPKFLKFSNKKWEWVFYTKDDKSGYVLTFSELSTNDPNYNREMQEFDDLFKNINSGCQCGAIYSSFSWDHMKYCPLWKKWDNI